jgi:hypothetical protein
MKKQSGMSIYMLMYVFVTVGFAGLIGLKVFPPYLEYFAVKKIFASMANEEAKTAESVKDIRSGFGRRASIAYVTVVKEADLEISKEGGETVVSANWEVKVPLFAQASLVLDFAASTK